MIGLSGGKDSLSMLHALVRRAYYTCFGNLAIPNLQCGHWHVFWRALLSQLTLQKRSPVKFSIAAATVDPKTAAFDPSPLKAYVAATIRPVHTSGINVEYYISVCVRCRYVKSLGVPYFFLEDPIFDRAKGGELQGNSICAYCSRMKRGMLYTCVESIAIRLWLLLDFCKDNLHLFAVASCCRKEGYNVLVLGQHLDDCAETLMMSLFHNGPLANGLLLIANSRSVYSRTRCG